ncbi:MAG: hypothetical protein CVU74_07180 [Deltaproteobacteria bacterium HGW-Deltaproteobacteria-9]|nr:MAG: hypothetical protein CVU74_07180 [Deltaproteobacteria bacterium HGW-Deltaproteobacteria-9]
MLKKIIISLMLVLFVCNFSFSADEFTLLREERIGALRIDLSEREVKKTIQCRLKRRPDELWGADGAYHQKWEYAGCGITLGMVSEKKGASKSVDSITLVSPSNLSTKRGIRIGSTEQEVMDAYKPYWNKEDSKSFKIFVAGSIYGGLMFDFKNGKVSRIFLGAAAE